MQIASVIFTNQQTVRIRLALEYQILNLVAAAIRQRDNLGEIAKFADLIR